MKKPKQQSQSNMQLALCLTGDICTNWQWEDRRDGAVLAPPAQQAARRRGQAAHRAQRCFEGRVHRSSASTVSGETEGLGSKVSLDQRVPSGLNCRRHARPHIVLNLTAQPVLQCNLTVQP